MLSFKEVKIKELINSNPSILENLTDQEKYLLEERLGEAKRETSYRVISEHLEVSTARARQILNDIYNKIDKIDTLINLDTIDESLEIEYLLLSKKTYNALKRADFNTLGDLKTIDETNSSDVYYLGKPGYEEIKKELLRLKELEENKNQNKEKTR